MPSQAPCKEEFSALLDPVDLLRLSVSKRRAAIDGLTVPQRVWAAYVAADALENLGSSLSPSTRLEISEAISQLRVSIHVSEWLGLVGIAR